SGWSSFSDRSTVADRAYSYRVRAVNSAGVSDWAQADIKTTPGMVATAPSVQRVPPGKVVIKRPALSDLATGWDVAYYNGGGNPRTVIVSNIAPAADDYEWTGADPARTYRFAVRARTDNPVLLSQYT